MFVVPSDFLVCLQLSKRKSENFENSIKIELQKECEL